MRTPYVGGDGGSLAEAVVHIKEKKETKRPKKKTWNLQRRTVLINALS
jgi:hypothetical protein